MTTYTISQFKAKAAEILDTLSEGEEVIITRRGKPCGKLVAVAAERPPLTPLQKKYAHLPDVSFEEFQAARREMNEAWERKFDDIIGDDDK